jgi:hypothetical protein
MYIQDSGSQIWIFPIPGIPIFQGSEHRIPDPVLQQKLKYFKPQKIYTKLSEKHIIQDVNSGFRIPDLNLFHPGSRFQRSKKYRIPDLVQQPKNLSSFNPKN